MKRLAILGASGHGKVVADIAECCGWQQVDFFDDAWPDLQQNGHWKIVGSTSALLANLGNYDGVAVGIGSNVIRYQKLRELAGAGAQLVSLLHPAAIVSQYASIGIGSVVMAGAIVNAGACVGDGSILNTGCSVDHDCTLGEAVHISPGARLAGSVSVGDFCWVGIGACVRQGTSIGTRAVIGAGAAVVHDVSDGVTAVGVPARDILCH